MNRNEFMDRLEKLLFDIPSAERESALEYYRDYFADAGPENEAAVLRELGSPEKVAETIKEGLYGDGQRAEKTVEKTAEMSAERTVGKTVEKSAERTSEKTAKKKNMDLSKILLIVLLLILAIPAGGVLIGAVGTVFGIVVAILATFFGLLIALFCIAAAGIIGGLFLIFFSMGYWFMPGSAMLTGGVGCVLLAAGILSLILSVWVCGWLIPVLVRGIVSLCKRPFQKGKGGASA